MHHICVKRLDCAEQSSCMCMNVDMCFVKGISFESIRQSYAFFVFVGKRVTFSIKKMDLVAAVTMNFEK